MTNNVGTVKRILKHHSRYHVRVQFPWVLAEEDLGELLCRDCRSRTLCAETVDKQAVAPKGDSCLSMSQVTLIVTSSYSVSVYLFLLQNERKLLQKSKDNE